MRRRYYARCLLSWLRVSPQPTSLKTAHSHDLSAASLSKISQQQPARQVGTRTLYTTRPRYVSVKLARCVLEILTELRVHNRHAEASPNVSINSCGGVRRNDLYEVMVASAGPYRATAPALTCAILNVLTWNSSLLLQIKRHCIPRLGSDRDDAYHSPWELEVHECNCGVKRPL